MYRFNTVLIASLLSKLASAGNETPEHINDGWENDGPAPAFPDSLHETPEIMTKLKQVILDLGIKL